MGTEQKKWIRISAIALVILVCAAVALKVALTYSRTAPRVGLYGVFLTNGQVYFGNITSETSKKLILKNIYYIQHSGGQDLARSGDIALLKLGNELHGPEDYMEINQSSILFLEKIKQDGKVGKAIEAYVQK